MSKHMVISLIKSIVRLVACIVGEFAFRHVNPLANYAFLVLGIAEGIGVIEEWFEK